ncbi:MAG: DinB family protein, partial [Eudoraea sp.]
LVDEMPENWPTNTQLKEKGWDTIWKEHLKSRSSFVNLLEKKQDSFLNETYFDPEFKGNYPYSFAIDGILHHEIYHLGQIGLVVKLLKEKN